MKKTATFTFYDELNELFGRNAGKQITGCDFKGRQSVKHLVESLRIPHTEVGRIIVNEQPVDLSYIVEDQDDVHVYPARGKAGKFLVQFISDNHLGKLSTFLRVLGFDVLYQNDFQDEQLARISNDESRILLTRDRGLLMRRNVNQGYCVRARDPRKQLDEVIKRFELKDEIKPFKRCLRCNSILEHIDKEAVIHRLQPLTKKYYDEFHICTACDQLYWKGSHYEHMEDFLEELLT
jgi:uncharacterized protein with PIN domain